MDLFGCGDGSMYSQAIASAQPRVRVMLFVIVFTEKVNAGSMEASSNVGGKVSSLDCALEIGRSFFAWIYGYLIFRNSLEYSCQYFYKNRLI